MAATRKYILRTVDGDEHGPVDQETLVRWAEGGRITPYCEVRSTLLARWEKARSVSFLRDVIAAQQVTEEDDKPASFLGRVKTRAKLRATQAKRASGVHTVRVSDYELAPIPLRLASSLTDLAVVAGFAIVVFLVMSFLYDRGFSATLLFYLWLVIVYVGTLMYFAWSVSFHTRTFGNKCWGLLVVSDQGPEVLLGRAYALAVSSLLFGLLTPFTMYILPSGRALQDVVSGTHVVKTRVVVKQ